MCVQVYGAALSGLAGVTKQVLFSIKAATRGFADIRQHQHVQVDVLPRKPAFRCSNEAALESGVREAFDSDQCADLADLTSS